MTTAMTLTDVGGGRTEVVVHQTNVPEMYRTPEAQAGMQSIVHGKVVRTTVANGKAPCPLDRVNRQFKVQRPELAVDQRFHVRLDMAGLRLRDRRIVGWCVSSSMRTDFVRDALEQTPYARQPERNALVYQSDGGSQYVSIKYSERLLRPALSRL